MYVRALYDYETDDRTSLSFREGDVIQVITQLDSGWWDGVIKGVRGWFPSNYCQVLPNPEDSVNEKSSGPENDREHEETDESETSEDYDDRYEDEEPDSERDDITQSPIKVNGTAKDPKKVDYWIPQATLDGRLFYFNTETGESQNDLPLESPLSDETGSQDQIKISSPDRTKPRIEIISQRYSHDDSESSDENSSEFDGEKITLAANNSYLWQRPLVPDLKCPSPPKDPPHEVSLATRSREDGINNISTLRNNDATSFLSTPSFNLPHTTKLLPRSFFDDSFSTPLTWNKLISNMKYAIDRYRDAINNNNRGEYVRRAEDISDHLRLLLAAGSGTTDNHSGQPSLISTNKELYPHFRDMMSKFSKLVISSHIAAADWPTAEPYQKCLQEADGVMQGVFSYVEVARAQRGEDIPRLLPGFVIGSATGGNWQNNRLRARDPLSSDFLDPDEGLIESPKPPDPTSIDRLDDLKRGLISHIRKLEEHLMISENFITPSRHEAIGNGICSAATKLFEAFKPWISTIESIDLSFLGSGTRSSQLADFNVFKQGLYDNLSDLLMSCQAVTAPLGDEWAAVKGESLEVRLTHVRLSAKLLETSASQVAISLRLLVEQLQTSQVLSPASREDIRLQEARKTENTTFTRPVHSRNDSRVNTVVRPSISIMQPQTFSDSDLTANYRKGENSKVRKFFGEEPTSRDHVLSVHAEQPTIHIDETPNYLKLDHEEDVAYDHKVQPPQVKSGTLLALVEQLTRHDKLESNFNNTFLLTYRSFTTARDLFELLVQRFQIQPPETMSQSDYEAWRDRKQKLIRFRVVNILKSWFENYWMEDQSEENKVLIRDVYSFARDTVKATETPGSTPLMSLLEQRLRGQETPAKRMIVTVNPIIPQPIMPKNMKKLKFLDIDVTEFSRQLTIVESKLYGKIKPTECLNKTWQKKVGEGDPEPAPNVKALILHSNQLTNWVAEMILTQLDVKKRVVVMKHFILVADKCRQLNNYSTLTSIISALGTAPIHRLKRTWDQIPAKTIAILESMRKLMGSTKNFGEYRESLHHANPPCIPFFGVYLTDLTFIEDGIPSIIKKSNWINFAKRAKTAEVIRDIQQYQNMPYSLQAVPELQDYILNNMQAAGDVHEMYEKSLAVEPREREDEKIVRVLAESGFL
ncbi:hypothetical protein K3495_g8086 [Podosphaera aphanis]|nr:hypothetical protein K3495_g8086 [Podosphaera aphanis]